MGPFSIVVLLCLEGVLGARTDKDSTLFLACLNGPFLGEVVLVILAEDSIDLVDWNVVVYPHEHRIELRPLREFLISPQRHSAHTT